MLAIKQTVYRTSADSPLVPSLIEAAERGKQAVCMVELKARFDERANIRWAKKLEEAGVHVVYGLPALKSHAKCILIVRREGDGVRHYAHIGTGNYNPKTARLYTDLGLFTADPEIGADIAEMFNYLTGYSRPRGYRKVLVAPFNLQEGILREIERTIESHSPERPARIRMKMNALLDAPSIRALYRASQAGVRVELNVRGICALRPGVPGVSENIEVVSVVGRFLEHSRIYSFERPGEEERVYIGSADLMPRNLYNRVELVAPVEDSEDPRRAARRARSLARRQHQRLGPRLGRQLDAAAPGRRAAQRPARADRAPRDARRRVASLTAPDTRRETCPAIAVSVATEHTARGWWLEEAEPAPELPPLEGDLDADVVVVGGGYTGMWTAWFVSELEPEARVVLLEAERCGAGPSGRNGGFVNAMWFSLPALRRRFGDAAALRLARAAQEAVEGIGRWCEEQGVDAWYRAGGYLQVSTAPAHDGTWRAVADACEELGVAGRLPPAVRGRGAGPLRLADLPRRGLLSRRPPPSSRRGWRSGFARAFSSAG